QGLPHRRQRLEERFLVCPRPHNRQTYGRRTILSSSRLNTRQDALERSAAGAPVAHTELVALRVPQEHPVVAVLGELLLLDPFGTQPAEPRRLRLDVGDVDVEVHPVLGLFRLGDALEQELWTRFTAGREEEDVAARAADQVVAQRRRPEGRQ